MTGDLFQNSSNSNSSKSASSAATSQSNADFGIDLGAINLDSIIQQINLYSLIWSAFVGFVLVADFYFYYRRHSEAELEREAAGMKSLWRASWVWIRYLLIWPILLIYTLLADNLRLGIGILVVIGFIAKFWIDIKVLISSADYFSWYKPIAKNLMNLFEFYKLPGSKKK